MHSIRCNAGFLVAVEEGLNDELGIEILLIAEKVVSRR